MMQVPEPIQRFWRETVAPRPIAAGSVAAVAAGLVVGGFLAAGAGFEPPPPMQPAPRTLRRVEAPPEPITFMKNANGETPEWVIGTDNIPGRQTWRDRLPVATVPDEEKLEAPRRGLGWLLRPWRWGRNEGREEAEPPRPSRRMDSARQIDRQAVLEQYERDRARYERERERYDGYAQAEQQRVERERMRPRYDTRYPPAYDPREDVPDEESEEAPYPFQQPQPPPPERWRYGR